MADEQGAIPEALGPLWRKVQQVQADAMRNDWSVDDYRAGMTATLGIAPTPDSSAVSGSAEGLREAIVKIAHSAHAIGLQAGVGGMETAGAIVSYLAQHQDKIAPFFSGKESPVDWPNFVHGGFLTWHAAEGDRIVHPSEARAALTGGQGS